MGKVATLVVDFGNVPKGSYVCCSCNEVWLAHEETRAKAHIAQPCDTKPVLERSYLAQQFFLWCMDNGYVE